MKEDFYKHKMCFSSQGYLRLNKRICVKLPAKKCSRPMARNLLITVKIPQYTARSELQLKADGHILLVFRKFHTVDEGNIYNSFISHFQLQVQISVQPKHLRNKSHFLRICYDKRNLSSAST